MPLVTSFRLDSTKINSSSVLLVVSGADKTWLIGTRGGRDYCSVA